MNDFREYRGYCEVAYGDIMHFGILGMKWGVRRYQNPDGTLTAAGKKRYNKYMDDAVNKQFEDNLKKVSDKTIDAYDKENWSDADDSIVNLSKTEKIKDAIKNLPANYSSKDIEKLAKKISSDKFGTHIDRDKRISEYAIYEALKAKKEADYLKVKETRVTEKDKKFLKQLDKYFEEHGMEPISDIEKQYLLYDLKN